MAARFVTLALSFWLMVSVFFWPHLPQEAMVVGLCWAWVFTVISAASFVEPRVRYGGTVLGVVLAIYALAANHAVRFTRWHDFIVGVLFVLLSAVPSRPILRHEVHSERRIST